MGLIEYVLIGLVIVTISFGIVRLVRAIKSWIYFRQGGRFDKDLKQLQSDLASFVNMPEDEAIELIAKYTSGTEGDTDAD